MPMVCRMVRRLLAVAVALLVLVPGAAAQAAPAGSLAGTLADGADPAVAPGTYAVHVKLPGGLTQFHPGVADLASAESVEALSGAETTVAETVMPHGPSAAGSPPTPVHRRRVPGSSSTVPTPSP